MRAVISEINVVVFILATSLIGRPIRLIEALSGYGGNGAAGNTIIQQDKHPTISTVYLGAEDKEIRIFVPENSNTQFPKKVERGRRASSQKRGTSGYALSQLIAHCPSLVDERNVLELGSGLGMVSAVACKYSRPNHVAITDGDKSLLSLAYASCVQLQRSKASVSRCCMDWKEPSTWPRQEYDMLLAADVLNDKPSILPLVNVIQHYLCNEAKAGMQKQAVIVDPVNQVNRHVFCSAARSAGLDVDLKEFPGSPDLMLLNISPTGQR
mmetsp:Transcript_13849/g.30993  ORF Transcript_13849/g.30993 Transcript_13849/m.30993 type:complete len:268 (-) Transcript_13849:1826-2629(-)